MSKNFNGDIYEKIEYMPITFFANTLRVGIIGGGRGSYIKAKTLRVMEWKWKCYQENLLMISKIFQLH